MTTCFGEGAPAAPLNPTVVSVPALLEVELMQQLPLEQIVNEQQL